MIKLRAVEGSENEGSGNDVVLEILFTVSKLIPCSKDTRHSRSGIIC